MIEGRLAPGEARTKEGTMSKENPDTERRPRPEGETRIVERSATQALLQNADFETIKTGAELMLGGLAAKDLYGMATGKSDSKGDDSKSNDSKD
jgi:hypothetical protein